MNRLLIVAFIFLRLAPLKGQESSYEFSFTGNEDQITVPFNYTQGFIILKVILNGQHKLNLILDTGAENIILFKYEALEKYKLSVSKEIQLIGSDLEKIVDAVICRTNTLRLEEGVAINNDLVVLKEDILALDQITGERIDGILGARSFWAQTIALDYIKQELTIFKKSARLNHKSDIKYQKYPLQIRGHKPYLNMEYKDHNGEAKPIEVLLDTGSALGLLLFNHADSTFQLPPKHIRASLGKGISGDILGYIGRLPRIEFSDTHFFNNIIGYFQEIDEELNPDIYSRRLGLIGNPILSRFDVIIDYLDGNLYLKANKQFNKKFKHDLSGLQIFATGSNLNEFVVSNVFESSPAKEAGFQKGDVIRRIGLFGPSLLSLGSINNKLSRREGKNVRIVIKRDGKKIVKRLKLKDYLSK